MIENYQEIDLEYLELSEEEENNKPLVFKSSSNILAIKKFDEIKLLTSNWKEVQQFVAGHIQSKLEKYDIPDKFAWNMYIVFIISFELEPKLINEIESDKFCCKKYIVKVNNLEDNDEIEYTIKSQLPLLAEFNFEGNDPTATSEIGIKTKIFEKSNNSILSNKFLTLNGIENIVDNENIEKFINMLIEEYKSENRTTTV